MIDIPSRVLLAAYGDRAVNMSVVEREDANRPNGQRVFDVYETNWGPNSTLWVIELSGNQEAARVTNTQTREERVLLCANNMTAEELFEHSILSAAEAYMS